MTTPDEIYGRIMGSAEEEEEQHTHPTGKIEWGGGKVHLTLDTEVGPATFSWNAEYLVTVSSPEGFYSGGLLCQAGRINMGPIPQASQVAGVPVRYAYFMDSYYLGPADKELRLTYSATKTSRRTQDISLILSTALHAFLYRGANSMELLEKIQQNRWLMRLHRLQLRKKEVGDKINKAMEEFNTVDAEISQHETHQPEGLEDSFITAFLEERTKEKSWRY